MVLIRRWNELPAAIEPKKTPASPSPVPLTKMAMPLLWHQQPWSKPGSPCEKLVVVQMPYVVNMTPRSNAVRPMTYILRLFIANFTSRF